jgi:tetratricopeptide (TPR) repeat protein
MGRRWLVLGFTIVACRGRDEPRGEPSAEAMPVAGAGQVTALVMTIDNRSGSPQLDRLDVVLEYALRRSRRVDPIAGEALQTMAAELGQKPVPLEQLARTLSSQSGRKVLDVRGSVVVKDSGLELGIVATEGATGVAVFKRSLDVVAPADVVPALAELASALRGVLGDPVAPDAVHETGLSMSLQADREFALGLAAHRSGDDAVAVEHYLVAVAQDGDFAVARADLALSYWNLGRYSDAGGEYKHAHDLVGRMSERDRLRFLADYYETADGELDHAIDAYRDLLERWPEDTTARLNLATAYDERREVRKALDIELGAVRKHPHDLFARSNLITYLLEAGAFERARVEGLHVIEEFPTPFPQTHELVAIATFLLGKTEDAKAAYAKLPVLDVRGGVLYVADHALAEGRVAEARAMLERAIADDHAHDREDAIEAKQVLLAEIAMRDSNARAARTLAASIVREPPHRYLAARVLIAAGDDAAALASAAKLATDISPLSRAYAKLVEGEVAYSRGHADEALAHAREARLMIDLVEAHELAARALLAMHKEADARDELEMCYARRGELAVEFETMSGLRRVRELEDLRERVRPAPAAKPPTAPAR